MNVTAPLDKGALGRVSWLVSQLKDAPQDVVIEAFAKNARKGAAATLGTTQEDRYSILDDARTPPHRFTVSLSSEMAPGRKRKGRSLGFIGSVMRLINRFYGDVVQEVTPWQRPPPKKETAEVVEHLDESADTTQ